MIRNMSKKPDRRGGGDSLFFHSLSPLPVVVTSTNENHVLASSAPVDFNGNIFLLLTTLTVIFYRVIERLMERDRDGADDDLLLERRLLLRFFWRLRRWFRVLRRFGTVVGVSRVGRLSGGWREEGDVSRWLNGQI